MVSPHVPRKSLTAHWDQVPVTKTLTCCPVPSHMHSPSCHALLPGNSDPSASPPLHAEDPVSSCPGFLGCFSVPAQPLLCLCPWATSGSQPGRWNCSSAPTAHVTALAHPELNQFAGEGAQPCASPVLEPRRETSQQPGCSWKR